MHPDPVLTSVGLSVFLQPLEYCEVQRRKNKLNWKQLFVLRVKAFLISAAILGTVIAILFPTGYFGPLGARIRGLFVKHTRTGNPLVDSVAEHQPASEQVEWGGGGLKRRKKSQMA